MKLKVLIALFLAGLSGCRTIDDTGMKSDICSVHHEKMELRTLDISPGYEGYIVDYDTDMRRNFPHHKGARFHHADFLLGARKVKAFTCNACDQAFDEYWKER